MRLSIPTGFQDSLVSSTVQLPVADFYGSLPHTPTGHWLPAFLAPAVSPERLEQHVRVIHEHGRTFTYVMDATNMGTREHDPKVRARLREHLGWLAEIGVDAVRVSMPFMVDLPAREFPSLAIEIAPTARLESPVQAAHLASLGAASFIADPHINRDFDRLKLMKEATGKPLSVVVDSGFLLGSPHEITLYRHSVCALLSTEFPPPGNGALQALLYATASDLADKLRNPHRLLEAGFVRIEDAGMYEELGIDRFVVSRRYGGEDEAVGRAMVWSEGKYTGNLAYLVPLLEWDLPLIVAKVGAKRLLHGLPPPEGLIRVDSAALDGMLAEAVAEKRENPHGPRRYARKLAARALSFDQSSVDQWLVMLTKLTGSMCEVDAMEV